MLSGPAAILLGEKWRLAWASFAAFGLLSTLWCVAILPRLPARDEPLSFAGVSLRTLTEGARARLFLVSFLIGIATSIYWAFSVDLVTAGASGTYELLGFKVAAARFGQLFWTVVERVGLMPAMRLFLIGIAASTAMIALSQAAGVVLTSGLVFGAFFVFMAATLGMWSLELFQDLPAVGFGLAFLLLSAGQFMGPILVGLLIGHLELGELFIASAMFCAALITVLPQRKAAPQVAG